ncbi:hypothetical protein L6452_31332 [Arctium lappa]|uniref:Uncharacterized protein n=1 Tax=Arctium lappa TaxID=4217 RepID=A0ACB8ZJR6_ARCLA|nr:hypothetical protein L6452_31332 [Arctium lappa]
MASSSNSQNGDSKELIEGETVYKKKIGRDSVFDSRDGVEVGLEDGPGNKLKYGSKKEKENYMEACNKRPNKENKEAHYAVNVKENQRRESAYEHSVIPETGCVRKNNDGGGGGGDSVVGLTIYHPPISFATAEDRIYRSDSLNLEIFRILIPCSFDLSCRFGIDVTKFPPDLCFQLLGWALHFSTLYSSVVVPLRYVDM